MDVRLRIVLVAAAASLSLVMSCGDGGDGGSPPATTTLPLQSNGLAIGGDIQSRATDVVETRITEDQLREIIDACQGAIEITDPEDPCARVLTSLPQTPCKPPRDLCLTVYDVSRLDFTEDGYIEVTDDRPGESLCESGPSHVCLRTGLKTSGVLDEIVASQQTTSLEGTTTSTVTSTETTPATAPATSSSSTPETTAAPEATSTPTTGS